MYVLSVTTTPSAWAGTSALAKGAGRIRTALGLHPQLAHQRKFELPLFEQLLHETRYVGEVGLDGSPDLRKHWDDQQEVFTHILAACQLAGGRILSVHSRRAATPVLDAIERAPNAGVPILHWFSGTAREMERGRELGCWFSVGPAMLKSNKGRKLVESMPRDRILTETDGPFATIEKRPAFPWDMGIAELALAELWRQSLDVVRLTLHENLRTLGMRPSPAALR